MHNSNNTNKNKNKNKDHGPGVKIPPPLAPITMIALGFALNKLIIPLHINLPAGLAWLALSIGLLLSGSAFIQFLLFKTSIIPHRPDQHLMTGGIFTFSRNPIYLAFLMFQFAAAIALHTAWILILLVPCYLFLRYYVIQKEELYLLATFGDEYAQLLKSTRRWC
jgi:protein-S-isoprenylcysteine O-methyltransferase Ste14